MCEILRLSSVLTLWWLYCFYLVWLAWSFCVHYIVTFPDTINLLILV